MKFTQTILVVFAGLLAITACNSPIRNTEASIIPDTNADTLHTDGGLKLKTFVIERQSRNTGDKHERGAFIRISYDLIQAPTDAQHDSVNQYVLDFIEKVLSPDSKVTHNRSPERMADEFVNAYDTLNNEMSGMLEGWDYEIKCKITNPYQKLICVECNEGGYTGGAHPNYATVYTNYVKGNSRPVAKDNIFNHIDSVNRIAEKIFRKKYNVPSDGNINSTGYWFANDVFNLNDNFTFRNDSIIFLFNSYEVAPYAMGTAEVSIAVQHLKKYLKEI